MTAEEAAQLISVLNVIHRDLISIGLTLVFLAIVVMLIGLFKNMKGGD